MPSIDTQAFLRLLNNCHSISIVYGNDKGLPLEVHLRYAPGPSVKEWMQLIEALEAGGVAASFLVSENDVQVTLTHLATRTRLVMEPKPTVNFDIGVLAKAKGPILLMPVRHERRKSLYLLNSARDLICLTVRAHAIL